MVRILGTELMGRLRRLGQWTFLCYGRMRMEVSRFVKSHHVQEIHYWKLFPFFFSNAEKELITAPLDGTILPGITRDSILTLCREWGGIKISERNFFMPEIVKAVQEKRVMKFRPWSDFFLLVWVYWLLAHRSLRCLGLEPHALFHPSKVLGIWAR